MLSLNKLFFIIVIYVFVKLKKSKITDTNIMRVL